MIVLMVNSAFKAKLDAYQTRWVMTARPQHSGSPLIYPQGENFEPLNVVIKSPTTR